MALPPIEFRKPRRDPSLVEQAIVSTLGRAVQNKLIDRPAAERAKRDRIEEIKLEARLREETSKNAALRLLSRDQQQAALARETERLRREGVQNVAESNLSASGLSVEGQAAAEFAGVDFDPNEPGIQFGSIEPVDIGLLFGQPAGTKAPFFKLGNQTTLQAEADLITRLERRIDAQTRRAATLASRRGKDIDFFNRLLEENNINVEDNVLIRDGNGVRRLTDEEQAIRGLGKVVEGANVFGLGDNPMVQRGLSALRQIEPFFVPVPLFSLEEQQAAMAEVQSPDGAARDNVASTLQSIGLVSEDRLSFMTDHAGREELANTGQFDIQFPVKARSEILGALWADRFFPDPRAFEAAKVAYGLNDPVAERVYRQIIALRNPGQARTQGTAGATPPSTGFAPVIDRALRGLSGGRRPTEPTTITPPTAAGRIAVESAEEATASLSDTARQVAGDSPITAEEIAAYRDRLAADPQGGYQATLQAVEELLALPDDELRQTLESFGVEGVFGVESRAAGPRGGSAVVRRGGFLPNRDSLRLRMLEILQAAEESAQASVSGPPLGPGTVLGDTTRASGAARVP